MPANSYSVETGFFIRVNSPFLSSNSMKLLKPNLLSALIFFYADFGAEHFKTQIFDGAKNLALQLFPRR